MKKLIAILFATVTTLSGCVVAVQDTPYVQVCQWVDTSVYGYADIYRNREVTIRIKETAYVHRQWRCN